MAEIYPLSKAYCKDVALLEKSCLSTAWSEKQLENIVDDKNYKYVIALENGTLAGVGGVICSSEDSAEIFTVAVSEEHRKKGIGKKIVSALIGFCVSKNAESVFLEVEDENDSAIMLYTRMGFKKLGVRKGFYHGKDALIMGLTLKQN